MPPPTAAALTPEYNNSFPSRKRDRLADASAEDIPLVFRAGRASPDFTRCFVTILSQTAWLPVFRRSARTCVPRAPADLARRQRRRPERRGARRAPARPSAILKASCTSDAKRVYQPIHATGELRDAGELTAPSWNARGAIRSEHGECSTRPSPGLLPPICPSLAALTFRADCRIDMRAMPSGGMD